MDSADQVAEVARSFQIEGAVEACSELGNGLIHRSYRIGTRTRDNRERAYVLQRINTQVFRDPEGLMRNVECVLAHLASAWSEEDDTSWRRLELVPTASGGLAWCWDEGMPWRMYRLIDGARSLTSIDTPLQAEETGRAFGRFLRGIERLPVTALKVVLPGYGNTEGYYVDVHEVAAEDPRKRRAAAQHILDGFVRRSALANTLACQVAGGKLKTRPIHGDTKFNNVLFDASGQRAVCVIDLDTVMPGPIAKDFGDCYRSILLESSDGRIHWDGELELFRAMTNGVAESFRGVLDAAEVGSLICGVQTMVFANGVRFLADYLRGDLYFHTSYPEQNLDRASRHLHVLEWVETMEVEMEAHVARSMPVGSPP